MTSHLKKIKNNGPDSPTPHCAVVSNPFIFAIYNNVSMVGYVPPTTRLLTLAHRQSVTVIVLCVCVCVCVCVCMCVTASLCSGLLLKIIGQFIQKWTTLALIPDSSNL